MMEMKDEIKREVLKELIADMHKMMVEKEGQPEMDGSMAHEMPEQEPAQPEEMMGEQEQEPLDDEYKQQMMKGPKPKPVKTAIMIAINKAKAKKA